MEAMTPQPTLPSMQSLRIEKARNPVLPLALLLYPPHSLEVILMLYAVIQTYPAAQVQQHQSCAQQVPIQRLLAEAKAPEELIAILH